MDSAFCMYLLKTSRDRLYEAVRRSHIPYLGRFAGRAEAEGLGRMSLIGMPFSENSFLKVAAAFRIPQSIERTACRNTIAVFSSTTGWDPSADSATIGECSIMVPIQPGSIDSISFLSVLLVS